MPRYFFDVTEAGETHVDQDGFDLPDLAAAKHEAKRSIREMMFTTSTEHISIAIRDGRGRPPLAVVTMLLKDGDG